MATPDGTAAVISTQRFDAVILDMDGVVTDTARVHAATWKRLFDDYLAGSAPAGADTGPFTDDDYRRFVDGRSRVDGVEAFLSARGVHVPQGRADDPAGTKTAWALANRKNLLFLDALDEQGPNAFASSVAFLRQARAAGLRTAIVTASRNRARILAAAGIAELFDTHVDGVDVAELRLAGKPDPAMFLEAAHRLDVTATRAVVVEDALAGVEAGRRGGFGLVVGVERSGNADALLERGADVVVVDLAALRVDADPDAWTVAYEQFVPAEEGRREALCTLGNGVFATRGAAPESAAGSVHYPGTYAAGIFNRLVSHLEGRAVEHESMVNLPNWLPLSFRAAGGRWLDLASMTLHHYQQTLDLRRGVLTRSFSVTDSQGHETTVQERRLVSMAGPHRAGIEWTIRPRNWSGRLELRTGIDGAVENTNVADERALANKHLEVSATGVVGEDTVWLEAQTNQSHLRVAQACRTRVEIDGEPSPTAPHLVQTAERVEQHLTVDVDPGAVVRAEKIATQFTTRDRAISEPRAASLDELTDTGTFEDLLAAHARAWAHLWDHASLSVTGDAARVARTLNLHTFHVLQTLSPHIVERDVGVPARGLHGEGYRGHVFWDELFVFPFLNLRFPELTRELLLYRYRRLPAARRQAAAMGLHGARYPWQSGSDGREETPSEFFNPRSGRWMPDNSRRQHHVSLAVAYNLWQYFQVTGDRAFLAQYGAEMLVEIARFWTSLTHPNPATGRYDIRGVMGPDEFHDGYPDAPGRGIDNNAYTNVLVSWLLQRARQVHRMLDAECGALWERLELTPDELDVWKDVSHKLTIPFHDDGIISQFEGYDDLRELDWEDYRRRYDNIGRLDLILDSEGDTTNRYKLSKQADTLMLFYLLSADELTEVMGHLGYPFDPASIPRTARYYVERMSHGSTLCRVAVAWVLARTDRAGSWTTFHEALVSDVADIQGGTTREGIHLGAMAGTLDLVQRCYSGLEVRDDTLWFNPRLPRQLDAVSFTLGYRGHHLDIHIDQEQIRVSAAPCDAAPIRLGILGQPEMLPPGQHIERRVTQQEGTLAPAHHPS